MALTSKIAPYDGRWRALYSAEKDQITSSFGVELDGIHHVGSTAVPGLAAKPEIDLLVEVSGHRNEAARDDSMRALGYVRGRDLSEGLTSFVAMWVGSERIRYMFAFAAIGRLSECFAFVTSCAMIPLSGSNIRI
jgi:GrpB-like predicted nucleotidyltransferase (UPF0157 family)